MCRMEHQHKLFGSSGRDSIIGTTAHPEGWEKIRLREAQWNRVPQTPQTPEALEPPMFTKNLESHDKLMVSYLPDDKQHKMTLFVLR